MKNISIDINQNTQILYTSGTTGKPKGILRNFEVADLTLKRLENIVNHFEHKNQLYLSPMYFIAHMFTLTQTYLAF